MTVEIRPLRESDLPAADRIFREAFCQFLGIPDPQDFTGDAAIIATRWRADPGAALGAYIDGALVGSSFACRWGSFGFLGPVSVRPDLWNQGVAKRLVEATVALLDGWKLTQAALFTFPQSVKHVGLYQKYGFWPQHLTPVMSRAVRQPAGGGSWSRYSALDSAGRQKCLAQCADVAGSILPGLDVGQEIRSVSDQRIGETVLIHDGSELAGFAVCHIGKGSEAESGEMLIKFGAVRPGADAPARFKRLLDACNAAAVATGCNTIVAGTNAARHRAYRLMLDDGFRAFLMGVVMMRPNDAGYGRADCFVIDDLR